MRVLILSDSLALPRNTPQLCPLESTYPYLLKKVGYEIIQFSMGGGTSSDLVKQSIYYKNTHPDIVIIQVGIVDCTPRFCTKQELKVLKRFAPNILMLLNNKKIRSLRKITYVSPEAFLVNIKKIQSNFSFSKVFFLEIIGGEGYEEVLPGVTSNINIYNALALNLPELKFIQFPKNDEITMSDFHHLTERGHQVIYNKIYNILNR